MSDYIPELVRQLEESDASEQQKRLAIGFEIEGRDQLHHGVDFIVGEFDVDPDASDSEKVGHFIEDVIEHEDAYLSSHSEVLEEHSEEIDEALEKYGN